ncbi:MAG: hypothetical protein DWH78_15825 [Planctomycetota bacterium]|nr:MAG: hypothetical protein DWH78_15825 [Planctomycetota bacterium]
MFPAEITAIDPECRGTTGDSSLIAQDDSGTSLSDESGIIPKQTRLANKPHASMRQTDGFWLALCRPAT